MCSMILFLLIHTHQILSIHDYIHIYGLYVDVVLFGYLNKHNSYEKMNKIHHQLQKNLQIPKQVDLLQLQRIIQAIIYNNNNKETWRYVGIFLEFLARLACCFIVSFLFFR